MRILITDDSRFSVVLLTKTLEKHGHDVIVCHDGAEAWGYLRREQVSLVISDWLMPEMDGLQLCRNIRSRAGHSYTYVILLTTKQQDSDRLEALAAGVDDFLVKPLNEAELIARIEVARRILRMRDELECRASQLKEQNAQLSEALIYLEVAKHRFAQLFEGLPVACFTYDEAGFIQDWNPTCEEVFGRTSDQVLQHPAGTIFGHRDEAVQMKEIASRVLDGEGLKGLEQTAVRPDGTIRHVLSNTFPLRGPGNTVVGAICASVDITERKAREEAIARSEELYRTLARNFPNGAIMLFDAELRHTVADGAGLAALGLSPERLQGRTVWEVFPPEVCALLSPHYRTTLEGTESSFEMPFGDRTHLVRTLPVKNGRGEIFAGMLMTQDITERKRYERQIADQMAQTRRLSLDLECQRAELEVANSRLEILATMDGLTGANNYRAFQERLEREFQRAMQDGMTLSLIVADVDHFKEYNDRYGHPAGDAALTSVAKLLQQNARNTDFVARYGGEEFAIVLPNTGREAAVWMAERLRQAIQDAALTPAGVTISLGLSSLRSSTPNAAELLKEADDALYRSKQNGRNCVTHAQNTEALDAA